MDQAAAIADRPGGELKRLSTEVRLTRAEIELGQGNFQNAQTGAEEVDKRAELGIQESQRRRAEHRLDCPRRTAERTRAANS